MYAYNVLTNRDPQSTQYIERYADRVPASAAPKQAAQAVPAAAASGESAELTGPYALLMKAVEKGLKGDAAAQTKALLAEKQPLEVVDEALIPALDIVGAKYEKGTLFLPQLLQAASAAQSAFEEIKNVIAQKGEGSASKGRIVLATVKGDVHDIGKNIVKVILENYGFEVIDLGRDVPVETVVDTVREKNVHLVGLSALMTTTLKSMEETIAALHAANLDCKIMVGGAGAHPGIRREDRRGLVRQGRQAQRRHKRAKERCAGSFLLRHEIRFFGRHLAGRGPNNSSLFPPLAASPALLPAATGSHPSGRSSEKLPARRPGKLGPPLKTPENLFANCSKTPQRNATIVW